MALYSKCGRMFLGVLLLAAMTAAPSYAGEGGKDAAAKPRPPSGKPYKSAAFDPARVDEIEALGFELEERETLPEAMEQAAAGATEPQPAERPYLMRTSWEF